MFYLQQRIHCWCCKKSSETLSWNFAWHSSNHRLKLTMNDTVEETYVIDNFHIFFDKLYSLYHQTPKNQRKLDEIGSYLGNRLWNLGRTLSVWRAASVKRSIDAVIDNFVSLSDYFSKMSKNEGLKKYKSWFCPEPMFNGRCSGWIDRFMRVSSTKKNLDASGRRSYEYLNQWSESWAKVVRSSCGHWKWTV